MKNLKKLQELLDGNLSLAELERALGRPTRATCDAKTFKKAQQSFRKSNINSEKELAALKRMIELATTYEEATDCLEETGFNSPEGKSALTKALLFATVDHLEDVASHADASTPSNLSYSVGWKERQKWLNKWNELSLKKVAAAKTAEECLAAYKEAPECSPAREAALKAYCSFATEDEVIVLLKKLIDEEAIDVLPRETAILVKKIYKSK